MSLPEDATVAGAQPPLAGYRFSLRISEQGAVASVGDGVAWIKGLPSAMMDEVLYLEDGSTALVFQLGRDLIGAMLLEQSPALASGVGARRSNRRLSIATGDALLGRVIDPLGRALDELPQPDLARFRYVDTGSPPIVARQFVSQPLYTGNKVIDTLIPMGKGQRELIIGDDGLGKSALALDAIIRQAGTGMHCVYVAIGQTRSTVANVIKTLREHRALAHTTVVIAEANELPGFRYLAPFAGCAIAEAWMARGKDALIVYDDLTKHAQAYRELSLLLHRPPGREAYPGDIFYLHARLLERSTALSPELGGGSMTALPIVETTQGEIAAYIPTNLISITDGQIYLDQRLFSAGVLPAIDVTRSVSRIGGKAQHPAIKTEAARIRLDYLQFLELEAFTRFGAKLEKSVEERVRRGRLLREMLRQDRLAPLSAKAQLAWLVAYNERLLDHVPLAQVVSAVTSLCSRADALEIELEDARARWVDAVTQCLGAQHEPAPGH